MIEKKAKLYFILLILVILTLSPTNLNLRTNVPHNGYNLNNSNGSNPNPEESIFKRAIIAGPTVLDPVDCWELWGCDVIRQVAETLWWYNWSDPDLPRINMLAESEFWYSPTQLRVTLRQGISFHDGTPFNAAAAKWNLDRLLYLCNHTGQLSPEDRLASPHSLFEDTLGNPLLDHFVVVDTYVLDIFLKQAFTSIMDTLCYESGVMLSPTAHAADNKSFIDLSTGKLVGTGPWTYDEYIPEEEIRFSRWDGYWGGPSDEGLANFDKMVYEVIDDSWLRNLKMLDHEVDYLEGPISDYYDNFIVDPDITFDESANPDFNLNYLAFNNRQVNITWRKAMSYAFDYDYMVHDYWQDTVFRSYGPVSTSFGDYYTSAVESVAPYYNITLARMILSGNDPTPNPVPGIPEAIGRDPYNNAEWGLGLNQLISFNYSYNTDNQWRADLYSLLSYYFEDISIEITDGGTDWAFFILRAYGYVPGGYDQLQIFWVGWGADYLDPINMIQPLYNNYSHSNSAQINDPTLEQMMEDYLTAFDHSTKVSIMHDIILYLATELYGHLYGFHSRVYTCHLADISNVSYDLNKYRFYSYPIKCDTYPEVSSSGDITFLEGEAGHEIEWNLSVTELDNPWYSVYKDDVLVSNATWISGDSIIVSLDALPADEYLYKIVVENGRRIIENHVTVTIIPKLQISHPSNISYLQGDTGHTIEWYVIKGSTDNASYHLYNETDLIRSDTWQIGVPIVLNVDGLAEGTHTYHINVSNDLEFVEDTVEVKVYSIPGPNTAPFITHPSDISYLEGDTGYNFVWYVLNGSTTNAMYYLYNETDLIRSDTWQIGVPIVLNVDGLAEGTHSFHINVTNILGFVEDTVEVSVFTIPGPSLEGPPQITYPSNISYLEGDTGHNFVWYVLNGSTTNAMYYIYNETDIVQSDTWQIGEAIILNVDGLSEGTYTYYINVSNDLGIVEDTVGVSVFTIPEPPSEELPPQITISSPDNCETFGSDAPDYSISISGQYDTVWYRLDDGTVNIYISALTGTINQTEWGNMEDGIIIIKFYAENSDGLIGNEEVSVIKLVSSGGTPGVPGYNLIALVGVAIVTTLLIVKKKFKK